MTDINKFSIKRFWLIARLFSPQIARQALIYTVISLVLGILFIMSSENDSIILMTPFVTIIFSAMLSLGPLVFTSDKGMTMLPAKGTEKSAFVILYTYIIVPLLTLVPFAICVIPAYSSIISARPDIPAYFNLIKTCFSSNMPYPGLVPTLTMATCLFGIFAFRKSRVVYSIILLSGIYILLGISNFIGSIIILKSTTAKNLIVYNVDSNEKLFNDIASVISQNSDIIDKSAYAIAENIVIILLIAVFLSSTIRIICNRQLRNRI